MYSINIILYESNKDDRTIIDSESIIKKADYYFFTKVGASSFLKKQGDMILEKMCNSYVLKKTTMKNTSFLIHKRLTQYCVNLKINKLNFSTKNLKNIFSKKIKNNFKLIVENIVVR